MATLDSANNSSNPLFDVEHALDLYAYSFCVIPAEAIYDEEALKPLMHVIKGCHIYLIGFLPIVEITNVVQRGTEITTTMTVLGKSYDSKWLIPENAVLKEDNDGYRYVEDEHGQKYAITDAILQQRLNMEHQAANFDIKYIGQAYGKDGTRNAVDRLLKHETLQKIAVKGIPPGYRLSLLLLEIQPGNTLITAFRPTAQIQDNSASRIRSGLDKLFGTTEQEQIALYEASLIRYFAPSFNKEFKDSFPSTNLKLLQDCYAKDFSAVIAEICIDEIPFRLFSDKVSPAQKHIAHHDLHNDPDRKLFFGL